MGLKRIVGIRQYTWFNPAGKMVKMYEVTIETEKTEGEFTFDIPVEGYTKELAITKAKVLANEIDGAITKPSEPPAVP